MRVSRQSGQATPEWLGLVLLVSLAFLALIAAGVQVPGGTLARAIGERLICAARLGEGCGGLAGELTLAYGAKVAQLIAEHMPVLEYEEGMHALPVDFRRCREDACAAGAGAGEVIASDEGESVTAFTHVIDCSDPAGAAEAGYDCSGERAGKLYLQFWLYYPGSHTAKALLGDAGFHPDDWESFTVRLGPEGAQARASSHHGYNGYSGDPLSDAGIISKSGWVDSTGRYWIAGGSHAGRVVRPTDPRRPDAVPHRWTPGSAVRLVPIESLADQWGDFSFEVTPPWLKTVYRDPEHQGT